MDAPQLLKTYGIGLTGGIATGKSAVAALLTGHGYVVIDADHLARAVVAGGSVGLTQVVAAFGPTILAPDGSLDRARMRAQVFQDPDARLRLEAIMHPLIRSASVDALRQAGLTAAPRRFFYEAALLFETGRDQEFQAVWATTCPPLLQRQRLMQRDGIDQAAADAIIGSQMPAAEKARRADLVIDTACSHDELTARVAAALRAADRHPLLQT